MRTETKIIHVYKFSELDPATQDKAIDRLYDLNVDHDWYEFVYEDAERIGAKITGFDLDRGQSIDFELVSQIYKVMAAILNEHGKDTDTHKLAVQYGIALGAIPSDSEGEHNEDDQEAIETLTTEFTQQLGECYRIMLQREYDYQTSCEAIIETIEANDYEFTEDGKLY